ncbi:Autophagy protein 16 [Colletotrichum truncatum]|uniref:Autophagy protein 16 n=1 Tax=Colletotrichum truncatum TaxID=5467 RepID=A0ACC3YHA0_COLTU|nr:Autophagy protein 16 [Colletotrichum truncatum]KAF6792764.1 Autophagy protein 16 [Colletotrichum truncatum]
MPSDWRSEYLASFREQEKNNPVNLEIVQLLSQYADHLPLFKHTGSQLSDRVAALEAEKELLKSKIEPNAAPRGRETSIDTISTDPNFNQLQLNLAEALRSNGTLQTRAKTAEEEVQALRKKAREDARQIKHLTAEKTAIATKLQDREHELREKRKLVENVQDEMITLNLQMAMAEKERDKVKKENKELVDRWMKRMAQEAEAMNLANER